MPLPFPLLGERPHVLAIGCHSDDIEIGCGGTLLTLLAARPDVRLTWVVLGAAGDRADEARASAEAFLGGAAEHEVVVEGHRDGFFPYPGDAVKDSFERLKGLAFGDPALIFTHTEHDRHQDHRLAADLTWNTFRNHLILEYEVPKYDGDLGNPSVFVPVGDDVVQRKLDLLREHFGTQSGKHWFDDEVFRGLMRVRGMQANEPTRYAEAFYCRKLTFGP